MHVAIAGSHVNVERPLAESVYFRFGSRAACQDEQHPTNAGRLVRAITWTGMPVLPAPRAMSAARDAYAGVSCPFLH